MKHCMIKYNDSFQRLTKGYMLSFVASDFKGGDYNLGINSANYIKDFCRPDFCGFPFIPYLSLRKF